MKPWSLSKTLDPEYLRRLVDVKCLTDQQIADMYDTTVSTIRYHRLRAKPPITRKSPPRVDHKADGAVPWVLDVGQGHQMDPTARLLRARNRIRRGFPVSDDARARVLQLEIGLIERNMVINYNRELGFHTVRRNPQLDAPDAVVRMPPKQQKRRSG